MILVELGERTFEGEFAARDLQTLDEIAGAGEQDAPSVLDECEPDGRSEMALAGAGRTSVIMPGVRRLKCGSFIRSIRGAARLLSRSAASVTPAWTIWLSGSGTARLLCCPLG